MADNPVIKKTDLDMALARLRVSQGTDDYNELNNKPKINDITLVGNLTSADLGLGSWYGVCETFADVATKQVTIEGFPSTLVAGTKVTINFISANTATSPALSINGGDAIKIYRHGVTPASSSPATSWYLGSIVQMTYNGYVWIIDNFNNTTYSVVSQPNIEALAGTSSGLITGQRFTQGFDVRYKNKVESNTTEGWNSQTSLVSVKDKVYIYTDHQTIDGKNVPGFKIGDGNAYVIDLPFTDDYLMQKINSKVSCYYISEILVFEDN